MTDTDDNRPINCRFPPTVGYYPDAALTLFHCRLRQPSYTPIFRMEQLAEQGGITAEQAREASHLLAQLAEYLECTGQSNTR